MFGKEIHRLKSGDVTNRVNLIFNNNTNVTNRVNFNQLQDYISLIHYYLRE